MTSCGRNTELHSLGILYSMLLIKLSFVSLSFLPLISTNAVIAHIYYNYTIAFFSFVMKIMIAVWKTILLILIIDKGGASLRLKLFCNFILPERIKVYIYTWLCLCVCVSLCDWQDKKSVLIVKIMQCSLKRL